MISFCFFNYLFYDVKYLAYGIKGIVKCIYIDIILFFGQSIQFEHFLQWPDST